MKNKIKPISEADHLKLIHELEVHQIELKMQNDELLLAKSANADKATLLSNLFINLQEGILLEDENRKVLLTNHWFCDMVGIATKPEALIGANGADSAEKSKILFKDPDQFIAKINLLLTHKIPMYNEPLELLDGRHYERDYIPNYFDNKFNGHLWKFRDVTESKQSQLKLARSEERFRQVVEQSQDVVWEVDNEGIFTYVSSLATQVYGYPPEQMIGKLHFYDLHPINEREQFKEKSFDIFRRKEHFHNMVNNVVKHDGKEIIVRTNGIPMLDENGTLIGYRGLDSDITEHWYAGQILNARIRLIEYSYTHSHDELQQKLLDELERLTNSQIGFFHASNPDHRTVIPQSWSSNTPVARELTVPILRNDQVVAVVGVGNKPVNYQERDTETVSLLSDMVWDIIERKVVEEELQKLNQELEERVVERNSQLEAANKELEAFSDSVSHDLRTPLRHIGKLIQLLLEMETAQRTKDELELMDIIARSAKETEKLIEALLSFSKLKRAELRKTTINTSAMVEQVILFFKPDIQNRNIVFKTRQIHDCEGDEQLIKQVWINLVSNAIKYTCKKEEAIIEIYSVKEGDGIGFYVKDNGAGFNMKYADKLFGVFKRFHRSTDFEGIGIGLANVKSIITRHNGNCSAEGEVGKGATFCFTLPVGDKK